MEKKRNYSQCRLCKYFVEDDETLKSPIAYCILLGINIIHSGDCSDFTSLNDEAIELHRDSDPEPVS